MSASMIKITRRIVGEDMRRSRSAKSLFTDVVSNVFTYSS